MLLRFLSDDTAAVTVDWVVLTAAAVGLGLASALAVGTGTGALGTDIGDSLTNASVAQQAGGGCDWYCLYHQFHEAENGPYNPAEWGPDPRALANARLDEFRSYTTPFLMDHVASLRAAIDGGHTAEPYTSYYQGEIDAITDIIAERG